MKTSVSIPDEIFEKAEGLARRLKKSRSQLYREALAEYFARHAPDEVTKQLDRALEGIDQRKELRLARRASRRVLERVEW